MKKLGVVGALLILSQIIQAGTYAVFGDSLSDTGNLAKFTYNSGKLYNEHLASYLGEEFPQPNGGVRILFESVGKSSTPKSLVGPNWAQGGAVVNTDWGLSNGGIAGHLKLQTVKQINKFLASGKTHEELENHRVVFLVGGNDLRIPFENNDYADKKIMDKSIKDVGKQAELLAKEGVKFLIIPKVPDISYTPKFLKTFGKVEKIDGETLYKEKGFFSFSGIKEEEYDNILDLLEYKDGDTHETIIKRAIKELLVKQKKDSSEKEINKWYSKYLEKKKELSDLCMYFNEGVDKELEDLKRFRHPNLAIARPDISKMFKEAVENPELYGFTNGVGTAVKSFSSAITPSFSNPFGSGTGRDRMGAFEPEDGIAGQGGIDKKHLWGKNIRFLFADEFHPSPELHKISADYMLSILENDQDEVYDDSVKLKERFSKNQSYVINLKQSTDKVVKEDSKPIERGYVHFGALRLRNGSNLDWKGLNLKNVGTAISLEGENITAKISDCSINNIGMITSTIEVNDGANLEIENGKIYVERGSKITYPFGVRVNGKNSKYSMVNSELNLKGKGATGITVGNQGEIDLKASKVIVEDGVALNIWETNARLKDTLLKSDNTGVHIFSNSNLKIPAKLIMEGGKIEAKEYAIKVSPNISQYAVKANMNIDRGEIIGGILTDRDGESNIVFSNSKWENDKYSSVTNLYLDNSAVVFSKGNNFNIIQVENYTSNNAKFYMRGNLKTNNIGDRFIVDGKANGTTYIEFENFENSEAAFGKFNFLRGNYDLRDDALKLVELGDGGKSSNFILAKPVYVGDEEYILLGDSEIYLTSTLVEKNGSFTVPTPEPAFNCFMVLAGEFSNASANTNTGRKIKLERPRKVFFEQYQKVNMENSVQNIFHEKDRNEILLASGEEKTKLKKDDKEVKIKSSMLKFSYPINDKTGVFFSAGEHESKFSDLNRVYFGKDKNIANLKRKDYTLGMYYQNSIYKYLKLDNILGYQYIKNRYDVENENHKNHGYALSYSTLAWIDIPLTTTLSLEPQYQVYVVRQKLDGYSQKYEIGNSVGGSLKWKVDKISLEVGMEKAWKLKDNLDYNYRKQGIEKYLRGEYRPLEEFKIYTEIKRKNNSQYNAYEVGVSYKF